MIRWQTLVILSIVGVWLTYMGGFALLFFNRKVVVTWVDVRQLFRKKPLVQFSPAILQDFPDVAKRS